MKIILIAGKSESGKSLSANIIKENLENEGKKVIVLSFASYLKFIAKAYFGWDGNKDETGRTLLQHLGTDVVRKKNPDFWVKTIFDFIYTFEDEFDYFILDDTRFENEITYFQKNDPFSYLSIRVERLDFENSLTPEQRKHPSETNLDNWEFDSWIYSYSGYDELKEEIEYRIFRNPNIKVILGID